MTYPTLVRLAGGTPVVVETRREDNYQPSEEALKGAHAPDTRRDVELEAKVAVVVGSPFGAPGAFRVSDATADETIS